MRNRIILSAPTSIAYELPADSMGEAFPVRIRHPVRCRRLYGWPAHYGEVPRQDQTGQVPGRREQTGVHPLHERAGYQPDDGGRTISSERQIELFFKWVKQHLRIKKFWGQLRKRRQDTDLLRRHQLLHKGHSAEEDARQEVSLRDAADRKRLTDRHYASKRLVWKT